MNDAGGDKNVFVQASSEITLKSVRVGSGTI